MSFLKTWPAKWIALQCAVLGAQAFHGKPEKTFESQSTYDFVVVGGGAAGLALAVRLSEDPSQSILVLEAGPFPEVIKPYMTPGAAQQVLGGRGVGGSTLINGLTYGRGSASIYNLWEDLGKEGWNWESVLPYFTRSTSFVPVDVAPFQTYNSTAYSVDGPIELSYPTYVYGSSTAFIEALGAINVSVVNDLNLGYNVGTKQEPLVLNKEQQRVSSYDGYYKPVRNRTNLSVLPMSMVQQVILKQNDDSLTASGVVYTDMTTGDTLNVTASKEVILSAGVFQTPQLLMLSGIGPQEMLAKYGIQTYLVNENVGRNLQDHFYFSVIARANASGSASQLYNRIDLLQAAQAEYASNHSGPLTTPIGATYGFRSLSESDLQSLGAAEALANRTQQAQIEYLWEDIYYPSAPSTVLPQYPPYTNESFMSLTAALLTPVSRGNVTLQSNTIQDAPVINLKYLESEIDQNFALFMFRSLRNVLSQPSMQNWTIGPDVGEVVPGADITNDATILEYIKSTLLPMWHASGTCRMLPESDGGVVDNRLRVYGVDGLRIVDASIFPVIPDQHSQGPTYMVAERAADLIKQDHGLR